MTAESGAGVLVDTSVWVAHFRHGLPALGALLMQDAVWTHPYVLLELACGTPPAPREATLAWLASLRMAPVVEPDALPAFIDEHRLFGQGCGMVDVALLASALRVPGCRLWTLDRRLAQLAEASGLQWSPPAH